MGRDGGVPPVEIPAEPGDPGQRHQQAGPVVGPADQATMPAPTNDQPIATWTTPGSVNASGSQMARAMAYSRGTAGEAEREPQARICSWRLDDRAERRHRRGRPCGRTPSPSYGPDGWRTRSPPGSTSAPPPDDRARWPSDLGDGEAVDVGKQHVHEHQSWTPRPHLTRSPTPRRPPHQRRRTRRSPTGAGRSA